MNALDFVTTTVPHQPVRAAIYARVSTFDQEPENQLQELRRYVEGGPGLNRNT